MCSSKQCDKKVCALHLAHEQTLRVGRDVDYEHWLRVHTHTHAQKIVVRDMLSPSPCTPHSLCNSRSLCNAMACASCVCLVHHKCMLMDLGYDDMSDLQSSRDTVRTVEGCGYCASQVWATKIAVHAGSGRTVLLPVHALSKLSSVFVFATCTARMLPVYNPTITWPWRRDTRPL